jgi:translocator protein
MLMGFYVRLLIFLIINFGALGLGGWLQGEGARSSWYQGLDMAPWTPPGWVFGLAWTFIMLCFSFFMAFASGLKTFNLLILLFIAQFILNTGWNAVFFRFHLAGPGFILILMLILLVGGIFLYGAKNLQWKALLVLPYLLWLLLAASLNAWIWLKN